MYTNVQKTQHTLNYTLHFYLDKLTVFRNTRTKNISLVRTNGFQPLGLTLPPGDTRQCLQTFLVVMMGEREARDVVKHPVMNALSGPHMPENYPAQHVNSVKVKNRQRHAHAR